MATFEFESYEQSDRSFESDFSDDELGFDNQPVSYPTQEDIEDDEIAKHVLQGTGAILGTIAIIAAKRLYNKRRDS